MRERVREGRDAKKRDRQSARGRAGINGDSVGQRERDKCARMSACTCVLSLSLSLSLPLSLSRALSPYSSLSLSHSLTHSLTHSLPYTRACKRVRVDTNECACYHKLVWIYIYNIYI